MYLSIIQADSFWVTSAHAVELATAFITSSTSMFCKENVIGLVCNPHYDWFMLLVMLVVETLPDKHQFRTALNTNSSSPFVSMPKLDNSLVLGTADEGLRQLFRDIVTKIGSYYCLA
jgi:hypothetical protein